MKKGKYSAPASPRGSKRTITVLLSFLLVLTLSIGGTLAYLSTRTDPIENTFKPSYVQVDVDEKFDGTNKSQIKVKNESDIPAFLRVKLLSYRINEAGNTIGGTAEIKDVTLTADWFEKDGYYYYKKPVAVNGLTSNMLLNPLVLEAYDDVDGGKQVIEVIAEGIQADGMKDGVPAVTLAWKVTVSNGQLTGQ